ncbi:hypothetical protein GCM10010172_66410 [Paractinoplanes ferrugineus]|uniref:Integral membrane protein n=1 Tax=Paractinoplanes ferrugineus TaxID=113564 RepID=A0A919J556_9ACTN|nr:hypothetical protein [Actinoplanes ferrugineus]GIE13198.1 hypothetical protein Afe05nite_50380 [Actinoplanes ferrugineus]
MPASSRVTELRVHGVGGAAPEALLGTAAHRQIWGDRIAGFYAADAEQRGRTVEAYCWGGLTSRSSTRVLWVLLFPFMLANLAGWTCSARTRADRWAFAAHRACARLAALGITLNLLLIAALGGIDLWAFQFGRREVGDTAPMWERIVHAPLGGSAAGPRVVNGAGVVVAVLLVLWLLSRQARHRYEEVTPVDPAGRRYRGSAAALPGGATDPQFFNGAATVRRLGLLHVGAGLAWLADVLAWLADKPIGHPLVIGAAALLGCAIILLAVESGGEWLVFPLVVAAALLACTAAGYAWHAGPGAEGTRPNVEHMHGIAVETFWLIVALVLVRFPVLATIGLLRLAGLRRGAADKTVPPARLRWPAAPLCVAVLGMLSVNVAGLGCLVTTATSLGLPQEAVFDGLRDQIPWLTLAPVAVGIVFLVVELIRYAAAGNLRGTSPVLGEYAGRSHATPAPPPPLDAWRCNALPIDGICEGERERRMRWVRSLARARKVAGFAPDVRYLLVGLVAVAAAVLAGIQSEIDGTTPRLPTLADGFAVWLAGLIPLAGVALLRWGWGRPDARRWLGVLWDVGTFWPRSFHPFAPPCYTERAVPDLQRRIRWLNDNGHRVIVVSHSQGSVLAALALVQQPAGQPTLVTFGSPLMKLYGWAFPAYIDATVLDRVRVWRNFSYPTDYIGGPVGRDGVDVALPDPDSAWYVAGEPMPRMRRHTGYWSDEAMWSEIDRLAAEPRRARATA